jgi:hypothetical protein
MPILTRNQRDRYEIEQRDAEWEWEREHARRERRLDTPPIGYTDIDARIASALAAERQATIPALRAAVHELLEQERKHATSKTAEQMRRETGKRFGRAAIDAERQEGRAFNRGPVEHVGRELSLRELALGCVHIWTLHGN